MVSTHDRRDFLRAAWNGQTGGQRFAIRQDTNIRRDACPRPSPCGTQSPLSLNPIEKFHGVVNFN
jgi:hypothetical protein